MPGGAGRRTSISFEAINASSATGDLKLSEVRCLEYRRSFTTRRAIFAVLRRYGMPDHFVKELIRLHYGAKVKVKIGEVDAEIDSTIGVRQGSCEGPVLFLFIMQAAIDTLEWKVSQSRSL